MPNLAVMFPVSVLSQGRYKWTLSFMAISTGCKQF